MICCPASSRQADDGASRPLALPKKAPGLALWNRQLAVQYLQASRSSANLWERDFLRRRAAELVLPPPSPRDRCA
jgi:hypothetical protein